MTLFGHTSNVFDITLPNKQMINIQLRNDSGKIIERPKYIVGNTYVSHTGIMLGTCLNTNNPLVIHNHPSTGNASIVSLDEYSDGQQVNYAEEGCTNPPNLVLESGLDDVFNQRPYKLFSSNCQHLTSKACNNKPRSKDLNTWLGVAGVGLVAGLCFLIAKNESE